MSSSESTCDDQLSWHAITAARLLSARQKSSRLGATKSRHGCIACKGRRVKCTEEHPACRRCVRSGQECKYAPTPDFPSARSNRSGIGLQLSQYMGLRANERRTFEYFLLQAAPRLAGSFDQEFWCRSVLQQAQTEPCIRDALLCISYLHESPRYLTTFLVAEQQQSPIWSILGRPSAEHSPKMNEFRQGLPQIMGNLPPIQVKMPTLDKSVQASLKHYNDAMGAVRERIHTGRLSPMLALQTCLLFIFIEIMQDNIHNVVNLLIQAEGIMRSDMTPVTRDEKALYKELNRMIFQSCSSAAVFGWQQRPTITHINAVFDVAAEYTTMAEANDAFFEWILECQRTLCEIEGIPLPSGMSELTEVVNTGHKKAFVQCLYDQEFEANRSNPNMRSSSDSKRTLPEQQSLLQKLHQWYAAFLRTPRSQEGHVLCLEMYYRVAIIWISTWNCDQQKDFDQFTELFQQIVGLAERYVRKVQIEKSVYTLGTGVLGPLTATAWKCRVPLLRRKATRLMWELPSTRECVWTSRPVAEVAARLITIEEEDAPWSIFKNCDISVTSCPIDDSFRPSESNRVASYLVIYNFTAGRWELRVTRNQLSASGKREPVSQDYSF